MLPIRLISEKCYRAFAFSLVASLKDLAKMFPDWIEVGEDGVFVQILSDKSPDVCSQVINFVGEYRRRYWQLQSESGSVPNDVFNIDQEPFWRLTSQIALYNEFMCKF